MNLPVSLGVIALSTLFVWRGSFLLEQAADRLSSYYRLPPVVQGAVIAAIGSSFPELSSTVLSALVHGVFDLGVATIVGSAIFNILVIPGLSGLQGTPLSTSRVLVYKDAQFYLTSIAVLMLAFAFALIYFPVEGSEWQGTMTRPLALLPVAFYGVYLFLQQQDTAEHDTSDDASDDASDENVPSDATHETTNETTNETIHVGKEWLRLLASLGIIVVAVEGLVRAAIALGDMLNTPSFLWGLTMIAAATSLPDAFVSVRAARRGKGVISIANVLGSNIFDLLIAIPAGVLIAGSSVINFAAAAPMMGLLTLATLALFATLRTRLRLSRAESWFLLGLYALFVTWMVLETIGVTGLLFHQT